MLWTYSGRHLQISALVGVRNDRAKFCPGWLLCIQQWMLHKHREWPMAWKHLILGIRRLASSVTNSIALLSNAKSFCFPKAVLSWRGQLLRHSLKITFQKIEMLAVSHCPRDRIKTRTQMWTDMHGNGNQTQTMVLHSKVIGSYVYSPFLPSLLFLPL